MTLDQEIRRGGEAERLMNDPLMKEAFITIENGLIESMKRVSVGDTKTQHELILLLQLFGKLRGYFTEVIETGKLATIQKETMAQKAKKLFRVA